MIKLKCRLVFVVVFSGGGQDPAGGGSGRSAPENFGQLGRSRSNVLAMSAIQNIKIDVKSKVAKSGQNFGRGPGADLQKILSN